MGLFDMHCPLSALPLRGPTQVVLVQRKGPRWIPWVAPIRGTYDRSGFIDEPRAEASQFAAFVAWARDAAERDHIWDALQRLMEDGLDWRGHRIGYALVDAVAFEALAGRDVEAATNGADLAVLPEALRVPVARGIDELRPSSARQLGQYSGYDGEFGCKKVILAARRRATAKPDLLEAIERCEERWRR